MAHRTTAELEAGLDEVKAAPRIEGTLELIVRRPAEDEREVLEVGELTHEDGLLGDNWKHRPSSRTEDGSPHPEMQLNVINARFVRLIAESDDHWQLAGDQLYLDLDLSHENLPTGTQVAIGEAVIEVTEPPHSGCQKFSARFGLDARRFANSELGTALRLRGLNAKVVVPGTIRKGDSATKLG